MLGRATEGLLIVNADDWGGFPAGTDRIARAFQAGAVTSSTAMVHMADSERAASIAHEIGIPLGLHLNLTQPFDGPGVPAAVRERQRRLCERYAGRALMRRITIDARPEIRRMVRDGIEDQLEAFRETYGREPTHIDSHHHVHTCPDVFSQLESGLRVRRTLARHAILLAWRFSTTARFHAFSEVSPRDDERALREVVESSKRTSVEIMVHPSFEHELPILLSEQWRSAIAGGPLGTYKALPLRSARPARATATVAAAVPLAAEAVSVTMRI